LALGHHPFQIGRNTSRRLPATERFSAYCPVAGGAIPAAHGVWRSSAPTAPTARPHPSLELRWIVLRAEARSLNEPGFQPWRYHLRRDPGPLAQAPMRRAFGPRSPSIFKLAETPVGGFLPPSDFRRTVWSRRRHSCRARSLAIFSSDSANGATSSQPGPTAQEFRWTALRAESPIQCSNRSVPAVCPGSVLSSRLSVLPAPSLLTPESFTECSLLATRYPLLATSSNRRQVRQVTQLHFDKWHAVSLLHPWQKAGP
jgi:hypothetical protein